MPNCPVCKRTKLTPPTTICQFCRYTLRDQLTNIPLLYVQAEECLRPSNGDKGSRSNEITIGINVTALSWLKNLGYTVDKQPRAGLEQLYGWDALIRQGNPDLPRAGEVEYAGSVEAEVAAVCDFLKRHLDWITKQPWAPDMAIEIADISTGGLLAAREQEERSRRIDCPGDNEDGGMCGARLVINGDDPKAVIVCKLCHTHWTAGRLILVALADKREITWETSDVIAEWLGLTAKNVAQFAHRHHIKIRGRRPAQYDVAAFLAARNAEQGVA
jgi:hypothetical protein